MNTRTFVAAMALLVMSISGSSFAAGPTATAGCGGYAGTGDYWYTIIPNFAHGKPINATVTIYNPAQNFWPMNGAVSLHCEGNYTGTSHCGSTLLTNPSLNVMCGMNYQNINTGDTMSIDYPLSLLTITPCDWLVHVAVADTIGNNPYPPLVQITYFDDIDLSAAVNLQATSTISLKRLTCGGMD